MDKYFCFPDFKRKALTLSYDDGVRQDERLIEILKKNGLKGTFNINGGLAEDMPCAIKGHMPIEEAVKLYSLPETEVAVHGYRHLSLADVDISLAIDDILYDRKTLEKAFGKIIKGMAYANGSYSEKVIETLRQTGIEWARTAGQSENFDLPSDFMKWTGTCHHDNPRLMELAEKFVCSSDNVNYWNKKLQIFYLWGHSYEFDENKNWEVIEKFARFTGGRDDIWYATNGEIFDYLQACERLQFSADGSLVRNPTDTDVYIEYAEYIGKRYIIPKGTTVKL